MQVRPFDPKRVADELLGYCQDAVGDVANAILEFPDDDETWSKKIKAARRKGVTDIHGWLADELYNDPDTLCDLIGDRLHENCGGDKVKQYAVLKHLEDRAFPGLAKACKTLRSQIG